MYSNLPKYLFAVRGARGANFPARLDAIRVVGILNERIDKLNQFKESTATMFFDDGCEVADDSIQLADDVRDCLPRLRSQLSQLIEGRLNQLRGSLGGDASPEVAALRRIKQQLLLPSKLTTYNWNATFPDVSTLIDDLCTLNDFGAAYSALQLYPRWLSDKDYVRKHGEIFTNFSLRVASLPDVLGVDIPKDVLDYPILFRNAVWSTVFRAPWLTETTASPFPPSFAHQDCTGSTILHNLAEAGCDVGCSHLLDRTLAGIDLNQQDFVGRTALHIAAEQKCTELIARFISKRADLMRETIFGHTPLHYAASLGCTEACELLLKAGADANAKDVSDQVPLSYAAAQGHEATVRLFLDWPTTDLTIDYRLPGCPLRAALEYEHEAVALAIMSQTNWKQKASRCGRKEETALHLAVSSGSLKVVSMVIKEIGSEVNALDDDQTALVQALERGNFEMVQLILTHPDVDAGLVDTQGQTPLHLAVLLGRLDIATVLAARQDSQLFKRLEKSSFFPRRVGMTAYELAIDKKQPKIAEMLDCFMSLSAKR